METLVVSGMTARMLILKNEGERFIIEAAA